MSTNTYTYAKHGGSLFDGVWMEERAALDRLFNKLTGLGLL